MPTLLEIYEEQKKEKDFFKKREEDSDEQPYLEGAGKIIEDIAVQTVGGVVDAAESAYNFIVPKDKEIEISDLIPEAQTTVGQFVRPASQFFIPYTGAYKIAKGGYMFIKNRKALNAFVNEIGKKKTVVGVKPGKTKGTKDIMVEGEKTVSKKIPITTTSTKPLTSSQILMNQLGGNVKPITTSRTINQIVKEKVPTKKVGGTFVPQTKLSKKEMAFTAIGSGAAADAVAFAPYDPNLADLMVRFPATKNALTEWLQTDPNGDPGMERLKNAIAGGIPSVFIPPFLSGVAKGFVWSKNKIKPKAKKLEIKKDKLDKLDKQTDDLIKPEKKGGSAFGEIVAKPVKGIDKLKYNWNKGITMKKFYINFFDNVRGLKYLEDAAKDVGATLPRLQNAYGKEMGIYGESRFLPAVGGMTENFLFKQTFKFKDGVSVSTGNKGLQGILTETLTKKHNPDNFFDYMGAKSLMSIPEKKFNKLFKDPVAKRKAFLADIKKGDAIPEYKKALAEMNQFNSDLLDFAVDAQIISPKQKAKLIAARMPYVPLYRDMSVDELLVAKAKGGGSAVKREFKGDVPIGFAEGELPLRNVFDNYVENINSIINTSYKNYVLRNTMEIIERAGGNLDSWAVKAKNQNKRPKKIFLKKEELQTQALKQKDVELDVNALEDLDNLALFRSERMQLDSNQFTVFTRDEKTGDIISTIWDVENPFLLASLNSISPKEFHKTLGVVKFARYLKNLLTKGVTLDPGFFAGANALRDTFSAAIMSKNPFYIPILSTVMKTQQRLRSNAEVVLQDGTKTTYKKLYDDFLLNGGSFASTLWRGEVSEDFLKEFYRKIGAKNYGDVLNRPKKVLDRYGDIVTGFENASRYTEFAMLRKAGVPAREAALASREVAVDFGMHGANQLFRQYTSTVPFLNAGLQGLYRTFRAIKSDEERAAVLTKIGAYVVAPTFGLYVLNRNNPDYKNTSEQIRHLNYMIPIGNGNFIKIPKPFELGAIGTLVEEALTTLDQTGDMDKFFFTAWQVLKDNTRLSTVPQVVAPIWNAKLNQTFFGSPIIPENMRNSLPDYGQYYPWGSKSITAAVESSPLWLKKSGLLMSPIEFENYYAAYTGAVGRIILDFMIDPIFDIFSEGERVDKRFDEYIFFRRFIQLDPNKFTQAEADFYKLKKQSSEISNVIKAYQKDEKFVLLKEFVEDPEIQELLSISPVLENLGRKAQEVNKLRNKIISSKTLSGKEKLFKRDQLEKQMSIYFDQIMQSINEQDLKINDPFLPKIKPLTGFFDMLTGQKLED